jgi:CDP-diacylglycerol--glycerol-3-phosphate 3-phosphatidyltransferase
MSTADQLTVARAVAVPVVVALYALDFENHFYWATAVFAVAMLTDQIDGWLARRSGQSTDLGRILDPMADKILVIAAMIMLVPPFPGWMVALIVAREFLVSGLRLAAIERGIVLGARDLSKVKTWAQGLAVVIGGFAAAGVFSDDVAWWTLLVALVFTLVSGLEYVLQAPSLLRGRQPA